jgi:hypothetical protein
MGPRADRIIGAAVKFCLVGLVGVWAWQLHVAGRSASRLGEATLLTNIPFEPFYQALAIGVGIYAVVLLLEACLLALASHRPQRQPVRALRIRSRSERSQSPRTSRASTGRWILSARTPRSSRPTTLEKTALFRCRASRCDRSRRST